MANLVNSVLVVIFMFSMICTILTISVYLYVKTLRNTLGKCIISCLFSMVLMQLILILASFELLKNEDSVFQELPAFFFMNAHFIWYSAISYHCWQTFKPDKREEEHRYQFLVYSVFVWIAAAGIAALIATNKYKLGWQILSIFNLIMFILTAINIWKVKREVKRFERQKETTTSCFNFDTQTYAVFLRMFVIMGVTWIYGTIKVYNADYNISVFLNNNFAHLNIGILYFVLLVLKRSTLKLIMESIRERSNEKRVRAQRKKDLAEISIKR